VRRSATLLTLVTIACGPVGPRDVEGPRAGAPASAADVHAALVRPSATRLVAVERGQLGSRLVMVDEEGLRQRVLTDAEGKPTLDVMPAWSPDGRWIVFASSRGRGERAGERFSLWIVSALAPDAAPVRLTNAAAVDWTPAWTPSGDAIVFASTGESGSFDLWRLELRPGSGDAAPAAGKLTRLTSTPAEEKDPAVSPDGKSIAYTAVDGDVHRVMIAGADGTGAHELAEGDEPAWSKDGDWLAYVAPAAARRDLDVWRIGVDGRGRAPLVDDDLADEHAPRLSADGCFLLATSLLRNDEAQIVTSTLVVAPLCTKAAAAPRWQALIEVHPAPRMGVALAPVPLRADVLARAPAYKDALKRSLLRPEPEDDDTGEPADPADPANSDRVP
jgi:Tol biopolymer transport system component